MRQLFFALATIVIKTSQWAWAKLRGKPYDSGMDMD